MLQCGLESMFDYKIPSENRIRLLYDQQSYMDPGHGFYGKLKKRDLQGLSENSQEELVRPCIVFLDTRKWRKCHNGKTKELCFDYIYNIK